MPWVDLANNQAVSFLNLWDAVNIGVFIQKQPIPTNNECITKADANDYVYINTSLASYAAKASNQLVVRQDLQNAAGVYYMTITGFYPVTGTGTNSSMIKIRNLSGGTIYLYAMYNSGGANSGFANGYLQQTGQPNVTVFTPVTAPGQTTYSSDYYTIANNTTLDINVVKQDSVGSGSSVRTAYSTTIGGSKTTL